MATTYYVDTSRTTNASPYFMSLSDAVSGLPSSAWTDDYIIECSTGTGTAADTTGVTLNNSNLGTHTLTIKAATDHEALKTGWDTSRYRLEVGNTAISLQIANVDIEGLQIGVSTAYDIAIDVNNSSTQFNNNIKKCRIVSTGDASGQKGILISDAASGSTINIDNTIIRDFDNSSNNEGIRCNSANITLNVRHCVIEKNRYGVWQYAGTVNVTNSAVFNNTDDFINGTISYCASDDGDGSNAVSPSGSDWDNEFSDSSTGDFTLLSGGNLAGAGTALSSVTEDIDGDSRDASTPDIGVDELASAADSTITDQDIGLPSITSSGQANRQLSIDNQNIGLPSITSSGNVNVNNTVTISNQDISLRPIEVYIEPMLMCPTGLYSNNTIDTAQSGLTNPTNLVDRTPAFSALVGYIDSNITEIKIEVSAENDNDFSETPSWLSEWITLDTALSAAGRIEDIEYGEDQ